MFMLYEDVLICLLIGLQLFPVFRMGAAQLVFPSSLRSSSQTNSSLFSGWEQPNWFFHPHSEVPRKRSYRKIDYFEETEIVDVYKPSFHRTNWFEPVGKECELVMNAVGVIDLTPFGKLEVSGVDAEHFMDHICANFVPKVSVCVKILKLFSSLHW